MLQANESRETNVNFLKTVGIPVNKKGQFSSYKLKWTNRKTSIFLFSNIFTKRKNLNCLFQNKPSKNGSGLMVHQDKHDEVGSMLCKITNAVDSNYDSHNLSKSLKRQICKHKVSHILVRKLLY